MLYIYICVSCIQCNVEAPFLSRPANNEKEVDNVIIRGSRRFIERDDKGTDLLPSPRPSPVLSSSLCKTAARGSSPRGRERKLRNCEKQRSSLNESVPVLSVKLLSSRNNNGISRAPDYFEITRYMTLIERLPAGVALMENRFFGICAELVTRGLEAHPPPIGFFAKTFKLRDKKN